MDTAKTNTKRTAKKTTSAARKADEKPNRVAVIPIKYKARGRYRIVDGEGIGTICPSSRETRTEDEILSESKRARLLDLTRNLVRNSSLFNTIIGQL